MTDETNGPIVGKSVNRESPRERDPSGPVFVPISIGELIDKIVILEIKAARISDPAKRSEVAHELNLLNQVDYGSAECRQEIETLKEELGRINEALWEIEDQIRDCERRRDFGPEFVKLARAVYITNDRRAALKRRINEVSGSTIREIKAHPSY
jgi:chromosome segregation ATPase